MYFPEKFGESFTKDFVERLAASDLEPERYQFVSDSQYRLVSATNVYGINETQHARLRLSAYKKYDDTHGIDSMARPTRGMTKAPVEYNESFGDKITESDWRSHIVSQEFNGTRLNYYMASDLDADYGKVFIRVEVPLIFRFTDEMNQTFHRSILNSKKIIDSLNVTNDDYLIITKIRSSLESAALFLYTLWDNMDQSEREAVVPVFLQVHISASQDGQFSQPRTMYDIADMVVAFSYLHDAPEESRDVHLLDDSGIQSSVQYGLRRPLTKRVGEAFASKSRLTPLIKNIRKGIKSGNTPAVSFMVALHAGSSIANGYNYTEEVIGKIGIVNATQFLVSMFSAGKAVEWVEAGFTVEDADKFYDLGIIDVAEAEKMKNMPSSWSSGWSA